MAASSGMGNAWASQAYERERAAYNARIRDEQLDEYYRSLSRTATEQQLVEEQHQVDATRTKEVLGRYQAAIRRGDKEAFAKFWNDDIVRQGGNGAILQDGIVWEIDENKRPIRALANTDDMSGADMLAVAQRATQTAQDIDAMRTAQLTRNIEAEEKMYSNWYDNQVELAKAHMGLQGDMLNAQARITAAGMRNAGGTGMGGATGLSGFNSVTDYNRAMANIVAAANGSVAMFDQQGNITFTDANQMPLAPEEQQRLYNDFYSAQAAYVTGQFGPGLTGVTNAFNTYQNASLTAQQEAARIAAEQQAALEASRAAARQQQVIPLPISPNAPGIIGRVPTSPYAAGLSGITSNQVPNL